MVNDASVQRAGDVTSPDGSGARPYCTAPAGVNHHSYFTWTIFTRVGSSNRLPKCAPAVASALRAEYDTAICRSRLRGFGNLTCTVRINILIFAWTVFVPLIPAQWFCPNSVRLRSLRYRLRVFGDWTCKVRINSFFSFTVEYVPSLCKIKRWTDRFIAPQ